MFVAIVLCGGRGRRLWPLSTPKVPKPFLKLCDSRKTLLQQTIERLHDYDHIIITCNVAQVSRVRRQLPTRGRNRFTVIAEPQCTNTAAAVCCALLYARSLKNRVYVSILPVDHCLSDYSFLHAAQKEAKRHDTVTWFATSRHPTGIVVGRAERLLACIDCEKVGVHAEQSLERATHHKRHGVLHLDSASFDEIDGDSRFVVPLDLQNARSVRMDSKDVGTWEGVRAWAMRDQTPGTNNDGNIVLCGRAQFSDDCRRCFVYCTDHRRTIELKHMEDCFVVCHEDRILVAQGVLAVRRFHLMLEEEKLESDRAVPYGVRIIRDRSQCDVRCTSPDAASVIVVSRLIGATINVSKQRILVARRCL